MIDLRSDTVTQPTDDMRRAMAAAPVGDDVYGDDPTIKELEALAAKITGKMDAVFVPSGTMGNQIAVMVHTNRGDEIILGANSHIVSYEVGAVAVLSGASYAPVSHPRNWLTAEDIQKAYRNEDIHFPDTGLVCLENALTNGTVVPLEVMEGAYNKAKSLNVPVHLDGARLFNAATYLNVDPSDLTKYCDTVMFCVSKGLCAPVGSLLCGDAKFIKQARKMRKMLGGGMRQAGVLAAAGILALTDMTARLDQDHANAQYLANETNKLKGVTIDPTTVHINMVFCDITAQIDHTKLANHLLDNGIKINYPKVGCSYRFVTHNGVSKADVDKAVKLIEEFIKG